MSDVWNERPRVPRKVKSGPQPKQNTGNADASSPVKPVTLLEKEIRQRWATYAIMQFMDF